jgi:Tol biopolymer transport system component
VALIFLGLQAAPSDPIPTALIGYTELSTALPGGRHANVASMRACIVRADGTGRQTVAESLSSESDSWTQFAGWSPDGRLAVIGRGWESPENARWEEEHKQFRFTATGWLYDSYLVDPVKGEVKNVTGIGRVSFYNSGLFFWPENPTKLGFQALIDGESHPFRMNLDGTGKRDLTPDSKEFAYGFSASPNGKRIAYHKSYRVYVADADGGHARAVETGRPFNFAPQWSADGAWILFVSGEHYNCHSHIARADGAGVKKIADRGTYRGVVDFLDVPDFHGGSSDLPVWSGDSRSIIYSAQVDGAVELLRASLDGKVERLTTSPAGTHHYHPQVSPDDRWLVYGSKRQGIRQLYVMSLEDKSERRITDLAKGQAAMWPSWRPIRGRP